MPRLQSFLLYLACVALSIADLKLLSGSPSAVFPFNRNVHQTPEANATSTYPSLVAITWREADAYPDPMNIIGGGVIWNDNYILTAASVLKLLYSRFKAGKSDYMVLQLGGHQYKSGTRDRDYEWDTQIDLATWPEWYKDDNPAVGNIAVIKPSVSTFAEYLEKYSDKMRCICEPQQPADFSTEHCLVFGYIFPGEPKQGFPSGMCTVNARIIAAASTFELVAVELAGGQVQGCLYEGSPLVCSIPDTGYLYNTLVGISTGEHNQQRHLLFTRVYKYLNWIEKTVGEPLTPTQPPPPPDDPTTHFDLPTKIPSSASSVHNLGVIAIITICSLFVLFWLFL